MELVFVIKTTQTKWGESLCIKGSVFNNTAISKGQISE